MRREEQERMKQQKLWNKDFNKIPQYIQENQEREKELEQAREEELKKKQEEREKQMKEGRVQNAQKIGKYKYQMKKTDFQTENELSGNLRSIQPKGVADLLLDNYDSIFRRNLLEPEAPEGADKKRQRKAKYKWHNKVGQVAEKLNKKNQKKRQKLDEQETGKGFLKNDLILI